MALLEDIRGNTSAALKALTGQIEKNFAVEPELHFTARQLIAIRGGAHVGCLVEAVHSASRTPSGFSRIRVVVIIPTKIQKTRDVLDEFGGPESLNAFTMQNGTGKGWVPKLQYASLSCRQIGKPLHFDGGILPFALRLTRQLTLGDSEFSISLRDDSLRTMLTKEARIHFFSNTILMK